MSKLTIWRLLRRAASFFTSQVPGRYMLCGRVKAISRNWLNQRRQQTLRVVVAVVVTLTRMIKFVVTRQAPVSLLIIDPKTRQSYKPSELCMLLTATNCIVFWVFFILQRMGKNKG